MSQKLLQRRVRHFRASARISWLIASLALLSLRPAAAGVVRLTTTHLHKADVQINRSGQVVWLGYEGTSNYEIYLWDGSSVRRLTHTPHDDWAPQINDAGQVVWYGHPDGRDYDVFLWDGSTVRQLTDNPEDDTFPQINNLGQVAWTGGNYPRTAVYLWDRSTIRRLSGDTLSASLVRLNNAGQVLWAGSDKPEDFTRVELSLTTGTETRQITHNDEAEFYADLNDSGQVVWQGGRFPAGVIYLWNGTAVQQLTHDDLWYRRPLINNAGQVVWTTQQDGQVRFWNGSTVRQFAPPSGLDFDLNDQGQVVWAGNDGTDTEIYLWNGSRILQLTNNTVDDYSPRINDGGQVAWLSGRPHLDVDAFLYSPTDLLSFALQPRTVAGGDRTTGTITLSEPAPPGGAVVTLSSGDPRLAAVPARVTVPAGATSTAFTLTTGQGAGSSSVEISASYGGVTRTATLAVFNSRRPGLGLGRRR